MKHSTFYLVAALFLSSCSGTPDRIYNNPTMDNVYSNQHRAGRSLDNASNLRQSFDHKKTNGYYAPYTPVVNPGFVVPAYAPPYTDKKTGRKVHPHWVSIMIENMTWAE